MTSPMFHSSPVYCPQQLGLQQMFSFGQYPQHQFPHVQRNPLTPSAQNTPRRQPRRNEERIKKPLNSFMLYMKCNRKKMLDENAEYRKMQSAELNKVMGENWQKLTPEERNVYEEMAKKEQENHKAKSPNWTARDNYAVHKRRQRRDRVEGG
uniref:HMG box domain-containing protein n=1 Tax=Steinernema glaseri TaxID=37863 RepID=A0A1I7ZZN8_9BILA